MTLPRNASKHRSGTRTDFSRQEAAATTTLQQHCAADADPLEPIPDTKATQRVEKLEHDAAELRTWLARNPDERRGPKEAIRKSNRTDNESARIATSKGVAAVDAKLQIIADAQAQAHGTGSEQELLIPVVQAVLSLRTCDTMFTADAGYHSEANLVRVALTERPVEPDERLRRRAFPRRDTRQPPATHTMRMKARIDTTLGRELCGRRFATVDPVPASLRHNKRLDRFTLRGRTTVDGQRKLFCLPHDIEKLVHAGYAAKTHQTVRALKSA